MTSIMYKFVIYILQYKRFKGGEKMKDELLKWAKDKRNRKYFLLSGVLVCLIILSGYTATAGNKSSNEESQAVISTNGVVDTSGEAVEALSSNRGSDEAVISFKGQNLSEAEQYAANLENKLEAMLSSMEGIGDARVMITLSETKEDILPENVTESEQTSISIQGGDNSLNVDLSRQEGVTASANGSTGNDYLKEEDGSDDVEVNMSVTGNGSLNVTESTSQSTNVVIHEVEGSGKDGKEVYTTKEIMPKIAGVLVLVQVEDERMNAYTITEIVSTALNIKSHRISVQTMTN